MSISISRYYTYTESTDQQGNIRRLGETRSPLVYEWNGAAVGENEFYASYELARINGFKISFRASSRIEYFPVDGFGEPQEGNRVVKISHIMRYALSLNNQNDSGNS